MVGSDGGGRKGGSHANRDVESVRAGGESEKEMSDRVEPTTMNLRKRWPWTVVSIAVLFLSIGFILFHFGSGIRVTVHNTGTRPIRSAVLHVTGRSYPAGDIAPGNFFEATVNPKSESHLEIEFNDAEGKRQRLSVDCYFEPGYRGEIEVSIKDGRIEKNREEISLR
jgi:hypothetical protein